MIFKRKLIFETCANCGKKIEDDEQALLIDDDNDQIFCSEACLRENFDDEITKLEKQHFSWRSEDDIPINDFAKFQYLLEVVLNQPDEIWDVERPEDEAPLSFYIGEFLHEKDPIYYIAATYLISDQPAFVYTHFPTKDQELVQKYRQGTLIYSGLDDDELTENDVTILQETIDVDEDDEDLGAGEEGDPDAESLTIEEENEIIEPVAKLMNEVAQIRVEDDIQPDDFDDYEILKIKTLEVPDEIWKVVTEDGATVMIHIAYHHLESEFVAYIVLSIEGDLGETFPVYGFPTLDHRVVDALRRGTNTFRRQIQTV